jgi:cell filamentation protein
MSYSLDPITEDCYPGTAVLINKLNIRDQILLDEVETTIVAAKTAMWDSEPLLHTFDFEHYRGIHAFLFEEIYDWSGQIRAVDISKNGTRFCIVEDIDKQARLIFARLHKYELFTNLERGEFLSQIVDFYCSTNILHPFRDGNGRTQRIFIAQLIRNAGYDFDFADIDGDLLMIATIQAANGVVDFLNDIFSKLIK